MKTFIHTLITSLFIATLSFAAFNPVSAQRRPGQSRASETITEKDEKNRESRKQTENNEVKQEIRRKSTVNSPQNTNSNVREKRPAANHQRTAPEVNNHNKSQRPAATGTTGRRIQENSNSGSTVRTAPSNAPVQTGQGNNRYSTSIRNSSDNNNTVVRERTEHNRTIYRIDTKDNRYAPTKTFKGNNNYWTAGSSKSHVHYSNRDIYFYRNYDHRKYNHWNRGWDTYYWNAYSWKEYYNAYHPHSYLFHKYYFHHPRYGHVIRRFNYKPVYFIHNNVRYYNYNGHFFRHFRGVGYTLVDMPYGLVFRQLPTVHERVYVNGFLYFRVGNLFFEAHPYGFALIHYPERYFAMDPGFYNGGYYYPADFIFHRN
jgi:hypothetical protein